MALTRDGLRNFYRDRAAYLETVIGMGYKEWPEMYRQFLNGKSMTAGWTDIATVSEFGLFVEKPELVDAREDDLIEGPTARVQALTFAKQHKVSEEAIEDDMGDQIIANRVPAILKAARATREVLGHDILNSGFAGVGNSVTTPDGVALFSAAHVNLSGIVGSSLQTGDLSVSTLEGAVTMLKTQTNDRNIPIMHNPAKLIVAPANEFTALKILNSVTPPNPNPTTGAFNTSAGSGVNPISTYGIQLVVSPYITDADSWFLLSDSHGLNWYDRSPVASYSDVDLVKKAVLVGASFRCAQAATDWRGVVGSAGA